MSKAQWIRKAIRENGIDWARSKEAFECFNRDNYCDWKYASYAAKVSLYNLEIAGVVDEEDEEYEEEEAVDASSPIQMYEEKFLIDIIEAEIKERQKKLTSKDLLEIESKYSLSYGAFAQIKDFDKKLRYLYGVNLIDLQDKISHRKKDDELRILREQNRHLLSKTIDIDKLVDMVQDALVEYKPYPEPKLKLQKEDTKKKEALFFISDIHMGETVTFPDSAGTNVYDSEIAKKRIDAYFEKAITETQQLGIRNIAVALGGDIVGGVIHEEITRNSDTSIVPAIIQIADYLAQWIHKCTKHFKVRVFCTVGNHGRILHGKPYYQDYSNLNFDTFVYEIIRREVKNVVQQFDMPEGIYTVFDVVGSRICLTHGHIFGGGGNGFSTFPNTIPRDTAKLSGVLEKTFGDIDYFIIGHFHTPGIGNSFVKNIPTIINGSIKGPDAFSLGKMKMASPPSQALLVFEEGWGLKFYSNIELKD